MRKFKLIKEYPGSPKLFTEVIKSNGDGNYSYIEPNIKEYCKNIIENNSEFWKEIIEIAKDYQILSFYDAINNKYYKNDSQLKDSFCVVDGKAPFYSEKDMLLNCSIKSIKRLSDNKIFTMYDMVDSTISDLGRPVQITGFKIIDNKLKVGLRELGYYPLSTILIPKKSLYKTEDGVNIYENQLFYYVNINHHYKIVECNSNINYYFQSCHKLFSTKIKAEEYIKNNKPQYSLEQIAECLLMFDKSVNNYTDVKLNYMQKALNYLDVLKNRK